MAKASRKSQQSIILGIGLIVVATVTWVMVSMTSSKQQQAFGAAQNEPEVDVSIVSDRTSAASPEMSWINDSQLEIDRLADLIQNLNESVKAQETKSAEELKELTENYDGVIVQQAAKIKALEEAVKAKSSASSQSQLLTPDYSNTGSEFIQRRSNNGITPISGPSNVRGNNPNGNQSNQEIAGIPERSFGQTFKLASVADDSAGKKVRNTLKEYVPAGSYVSATVLSGADAATNVADRENPIPVLFRVTGAAVTAGNGRQNAKVNLKGCTVQGTAMGDLSSERVQVRLISMTCLKRSGEIIETQVSGYMTGRGKSGVRGHVVSREGGLVTNAAIAGALNGLAGAVNGASGTDKNINDIGSLATRAASAAGAGGVQEAAATLSEYYIKRAEQYQPVVTLNPGTQVDLVFLEGVSLK